LAPFQKSLPITGLKHNTVAVHMLQSICAAFFFANSQIGSRLTVFLMVLPQGKKSRKHGTISDTMMILLQTPSATCLQHHMAEVVVAELEEQLKA
jgi:hypothetical protein